MVVLIFRPESLLAQVDQGCMADCLSHRLSSAGMNLGEGQDVFAMHLETHFSPLKPDSSNTRHDRLPL